MPKKCLEGSLGGTKPYARPGASKRAACNSSKSLKAFMKNLCVLRSLTRNRYQSSPFIFRLDTNQTRIPADGKSGITSPRNCSSVWSPRKSCNSVSPALSIVSSTLSKALRQGPPMSESLETDVLTSSFSVCAVSSRPTCSPNRLHSSSSCHSARPKSLSCQHSCSSPKSVSSYLKESVTHSFLPNCCSIRSSALGDKPKSETSSPTSETNSSVNSNQRVSFPDCSQPMSVFAIPLGQCWCRRASSATAVSSCIASPDSSASSSHVCNV
mmetsp:Transcript_11951/g.23216  ORF Transcript_11951/g.23216 Transcript_11951/m.23216 type:complete len:269 (-) Transcript_11951:165-971(-)